MRDSIIRESFHRVIHVLSRNSDYCTQPGKNFKHFQDLVGLPGVSL